MNGVAVTQFGLQLEILSVVSPVPAKVKAEPPVKYLSFGEPASIEMDAANIRAASNAVSKILMGIVEHKKTARRNCMTRRYFRKRLRYAVAGPPVSGGFCTVPVTLSAPESTLILSMFAFAVDAIAGAEALTMLMISASAAGVIGPFCV